MALGTMSTLHLNKQNSSSPQLLGGIQGDSEPWFCFILYFSIGLFTPSDSVFSESGNYT